MHELAITENIIAIAEAAARDEGATRITGIKVKIGEFTGVVPEALDFSFSVAKQGTLAENASLEIEFVPLRKRCSACDKISEGGFDFWCRDCQIPVEIISGRELQIEYVEME
jgi:hydrogenase nickel incorporation protein HypA/HybF